MRRLVDSGAIVAVAALLAVLPSVAAATFQGQDGYLVLTHGEGQAPKLAAPRQNGEVLFPEEIESAGRFAGSADGQRLGAIADIGNRLGIRVGTWNGTGMQAVPGTDDADDPTFRPDGQTLAFVRGGRIRTIPVTGGTRIVYVTGEDEADIGVIDVGTGATTAFTDTPTTNEDHPSCAPDGTRLVFTGNRPPTATVTSTPEFPRTNARVTFTGALDHERRFAAGDVPGALEAASTIRLKCCGRAASSVSISCRPAARAPCCPACGRARRCGP